MVLFLEIDFDNIEVRVPLFVLGLVFAFGGVYLINALKENHDHTEGEGKEPLKPPSGSNENTCMCPFVCICIRCMHMHTCTYAQTRELSYIRILARGCAHTQTNALGLDEQG